MKVSLKEVTTSVPGSQRALLQITEFSVIPGASYLIQGPSGAGKTTCLHLLAGLLHPDSGEITWDSQRVTSLSDQKRSELRREKFGIIFQRHNLLDHLTALENVLLCPPRRIPTLEQQARAMKALESLGLKDSVQKLAGVMSLGEQQRIAIARVLAFTPDIILADEPTSSLDLANANIVMESLKKAQSGGSLVVVSHDQRITSYFDHVFNIEKWLPQNRSQSLSPTTKPTEAIR